MLYESGTVLRSDDLRQMWLQIDLFKNAAWSDVANHCIELFESDREKLVKSHVILWSHRHLGHRETSSYMPLLQNQAILMNAFLLLLISYQITL